ncbi:efflux RND transporter periplasmic adaptor subunit [Asticcacaulis sp. AND118]|uniref:efflux RND transporter periplasmic adaptor subunit n=1 Tax=Asticcacaulis sp. AND118 TaxID=2840468 RepID=UPI001CFF5728|nr:HlyD family efflux transporter periplasmic adaptor subunit [Asticcacaulis sp. AND118]UDF05281.1 efflux RND transporter periplasmic adaptor subunit [Asticcacaulis sp. AND118]
MTQTYTQTRRFVLLAAAGLSVMSLVACGKPATKDEHGEGAGEDFERGPHKGRLLRKGEFSLEVTIFESGVEPEFRFYPYWQEKPLDPKSVTVTTKLTRLGGKVDRFAFAAQDDYLRGQGVVEEPHSFDVRIDASHRGQAYAWTYASYEGRTTITPQAATAAGLTVAAVGPATLLERLDLAGRVETKPEGRSEVRAWYPGRIMAMTVELGQSVRKGQVIARVESSESLQTYAIPAPISGTVIEKNANVGGVAYDSPLYVIADPNALHAEFFLFPRDAEKVRVGQTVEVRAPGAATPVVAKVEAILPSIDEATQTVMAHVHLPGSNGGIFRSGLGIEGSFLTGEQSVPVAVRTEAIQTFRDRPVVYTQVGDTYEVRMIEVGRQTPEWTEVLSGIEPGDTYVVKGAFLIRADIEKSGASHDH